MDPRNSIPGIDAIERRMTAADARLFAQDPGPGNPYVGRQPAAGPATSPLRAAAPPPISDVRPTWREGTKGLSAGQKAQYVAGRTGAAMLRGAPAVVAGTGVVSHMNDYKIDDPDVDSSAAGTWNALKSGDLSGAWKSASKGALEAGMDLGSAASNALDYVVPGKAPVSSAYDQMLRNAFGDQLIRHGGSAAPAPSAPSRTFRAAAEPRDPQGMDPRPKSDQPVQAVNPSGTVTYDPTTKTYSGANIRDGFTFNGSRNGGGNLSVVPGMSQAEIAATVSRPDPRLAEANRGALDFGSEPMIINAGRLGDGLRKSGKDSRGARMRDEMAMRERIADAQIRATLRGQDVGYAGQQLSADVSRRGQDITREGQLLSSDTSRRGQDMSLYGQLAPKQMEMEMAARMRNLRAQYLGGGKGDPTTAAQLAARDGYADLAKQFMEQAQTDQALGEGRSKAVDKLFENRFMTPGKDGTPTRREDLEAAARHSLMQQTGGEYANLPVAEQNRAAAEAYQRVRLLDGANALRGNVFTAMGLANPPPAYANLPTAEQVKGGSLRRLGWTDLDSWIPGGPGKGDYELSTPKNGTVPLRGDTVDQAVIKNLLDQGVTLR